MLKKDKCYFWFTSVAFWGIFLHMGHNLATKSVCTYRKASTNAERGAIIILGYKKRHEQVFNGNIRNMSACTQTDIHKLRMDMEQDTPRNG